MFYVTYSMLRILTCYTTLMFPFSSKKESGCVLVFDIASGSVGGAIVLTSKTHIPTVLYSFRSEMPFQEEARGARLLSLMLRSLSEVILAITHEGFSSAGFGANRPVIKEVIVSLSAPFVVSRTSFLKLRNKEPSLITSDVFFALLRHTKEEEANEENLLPKGGVCIEQKLIKSVLNGYETSSPYGKTATEAEFAVFESFSVPQLSDKISDTLTHLIHPKHISFHAFSLIAFSTIREQYPEQQDFMTADISAEQTEIGMVKKGVLVETVTFPFGRNHFIREVQKRLRVPFSGISAFLKLYREGKGVGPLFEKTRKLLQASEVEWLSQFMKTLSVFSEEMFLPTAIFLTVDDDVAHLFRHAIDGNDFSKFTLSAATLNTTLVSDDSLHPLVTSAPSAVKDPFIALVSVFSNRLRQVS